MQHCCSTDEEKARWEAVANGYQKCQDLWKSLVRKTAVVTGSDEEDAEFSGELAKKYAFDLEGFVLGEGLSVERGREEERKLEESLSVLV